MAEIDRQLIDLTPQEEDELCSYVVEYLYSKGQGVLPRDTREKCYMAYNQQWQSPLLKEHSWMKKIALYMQTMTQLVDTWQSILTQFIFPQDDDYISVEDDDVGEFWQEVLLHNFNRTDFIANTQEAILQAGITGDNTVVITPKGRYFEVKAVPVNEVVYYPLCSNITETNKVMMVRKSEYQLRTSPNKYFNLDVLRTVPYWNYNQMAQTARQSGPQRHIPVAGRNEVSLGDGFLLYQSFINYFKFNCTGKEIVNVIATVCENPRKLIRYEPQGTYDLFVRNTWRTMPPGTFWGKGIVEPNLSPLSYMNTMATLGLADKYLRILGTYTYNVNDEYTHLQVLRKKLALRPGAFIPVGGAANIQPLIADRKYPQNAAEEFNLFWKNEMVETVGAFPILSGSQDSTPDPTATQSSYRAQGAQGKAKVVADHWDQTYTKRICYRVILAIHEKLTTIPQYDPNTGAEIARIPQLNVDELLFWMHNIGWDEETIQSKMNDGRFLQALMKPLEENQIKPTGTSSVANKMQAQQNFFNAFNGAAGTPEINFLKWDKIAEKRVEFSGLKNPNQYVYSQEDILKQQITQIQQTIAAGVDEQGNPLDNAQLNSLRAQLMQKMSEYSGSVNQMQPLPTQAPIPTTDENTNNLIGGVSSPVPPGPPEIMPNITTGIIPSGFPGGQENQIGMEGQFNLPS